MSKRGRPSKRGGQNPIVFFRAMVALKAFDEARSDGEKYSGALKAGVAAVRRAIPNISMSETEMKRILAEFHSSHLKQTLLVTDSDDTIEIDGIKLGRAFSLCSGPVPSHPRTNRLLNTDVKPYSH
jgi:hypothetical protein